MLSQATRKRTNKKVNPPLICSVLKSGTPRKHGTVGKKVKRKTHLSSISGYISPGAASPGGYSREFWIGCATKVREP